jgi:outer membrane protein OmpA-like peptidoglycan-associated protein
MIITKGGHTMKMLMIIASAGILMAWAGLAAADDLVFPQTEADIVSALKIKDGKTIYNGSEYASEGGSVYKIIGGKRYKMRGLESIVDSDITPKAGALIHFDFDSANVKLDSYPLLDEFGKALEGGLADAVVAVAGHTDSKGTDDYNMSLSEKRAIAIKEYLVVKYNISPDRVVVKAYGKSKPIASNESLEGQARNRRVEFIRIGGL